MKDSMGTPSIFRLCFNNIFTGIYCFFPRYSDTAIPPFPILIAEAIAAIVSSVVTIEPISHYIMNN